MQSETSIQSSHYPNIQRADHTHRLHRFSIYLLLLLLACLLAACDAPTSDVEVDKQAENIIRAFQAGDVDKLMSFYTKEFYKTRTPEQWRDEVQAVFKNFGPVKSISMRNKSADTRFSGKFYIYQFDSLHDNDKRVRHTLTLIRPVDRSDSIVVVGHLIKTH